jgi:hypothetical protein
MTAFIKIRLMASPAIVSCSLEANYALAREMKGIYYAYTGLLQTCAAEPRQK